jgi:hypothetical protein
MNTNSKRKVVTPTETPSGGHEHGSAPRPATDTDAHFHSSGGHSYSSKANKTQVLNTVCRA